MTESVNQATIALLDGKLRVHDDTIWAGVTAAARNHQLNTIRFVGGFLNHPDPAERQLNAVYDLIDRAQIAGIIAASSDQLTRYTTSEPQTTFLDRFDALPFVSGGTEINEHIPHISHNIASDIRQLLIHLIEVHGYRRIAHLHGPIDTDWSQERFEIYQATLAEYDLPFEPSLVVAGDITIDSGYQALQDLLGEPEQQIDAIFAANDNMALGAIRALQDRGLRVPHDIAVVGVDDSEVAGISYPPVTTVQQSFQTLGVVATDTLYDLMHDQTVDHTIYLPKTGFQIRRSCGCFSANILAAGTSVAQSVASFDTHDALLAAATDALPGIAPEILSALLDSLLTEVPDDAFLSTLDEVLAQAVIEQESIDGWQSTLTSLRQLMLDYPPAAHQEDLWHQARILVAGAAARAQALQRSEAERREERLREIAQQLVVTVSLDDLSAILVRELPRLGINYFCIAHYLPETTTQVRVVAAANSAGMHLDWQPEHLYRAHDLTPAALGRPPAPYNLTVEALYFQDEALGFAVFEAEPRLAPVYEALCVSLSSAIKSAQLFAAVQRDAEQLEAQVAARTQELEQESAERERIAASLRESQTMLELVLDSIPLKVFWKDRNSVFMGANRASWQDAGKHSSAEMVGVTDYDLVQPEMAAQYQADDRRVITTGQPMLNYEEVVVSAAGEHRWLNTNKVPLRNHAGEIIGVLVMLQDITDLKKAQDELELERNLLRTIVEHAPMEIYAKDTDSRFTLANAVTRTKLGVAHEAELLGKRDTDLPVFADQPTLAATLLAEEQQIMQTGIAILDQEYQPVDWPVAAGHQRWLVVNKVPLRTPDGEIVGLVGINHDMTERKQAEAALRQSEEKFALAFHAAPVAISITNAGDGRMIEINEGFTRMFGYSRDEVLGHTSRELNLHVSLDNRDQSLQQLREHGRVYQLELTGRRKSGDLLTCLISMETINLNGEDCIVTISHDITDQRAAEAALRESEARYRRMIDAAPMAINVYLVNDNTSRIVYANGMSAELLGATSREALIGLDPDKLIPADNRAYGKSRAKMLRKGQSPGTGHFVVNRLDGRQIEVEVGSIPHVYDGQPAVLSILQDVTERRAAEAALRASEARYRQIVEAAPMATTIYLNDGALSHFVYINAAAVRLFGGQDLEQFIGMNPLDLISDADRDIGRDRMQRLQDGEAPGMAQYRLQRLDGHEIEIEIGSIPYVYDGQPAVLSILQDVTERKQAEVALRQSEEKFARAFRAVPDSVSISTVNEGRFVELNEGFTRVFGYSRAEALGKTAAELNVYGNPFDRNLLLEILRQHGRVHNLELRGRHKSGEIRMGMLSAEPITIGTEACLVTIVHDITEQRRAEAALLASEERYRIISELISDYAYAFQVKPDGAVEHEWTTAEAYQRLTGYPVDEPDPQNLLYHPDDRDRATRDARRSVMGEPTGGEYRIITKNGDRRWIRMSRQIQWDEQHQRVVRLYGVAQDITHHKQYEAERERLIAELEQRNLEMERFLYTVSHDLRSPLITMQGFVGYLEQDIANADTKRIQTDLDYIQTATDQMETLLDDLLQLSRAGRVENAISDVSLTEVIEKANRLVAGSVTKRAVKVNIAPDLPHVRGDEARLLAVFQNLIENGVKYMGDQANPEIEIGAAVTGDWVRCFVRDNGIGIDPAYHHKIFGLFDQLNPAFGGSGIGLALVQRIVAAHGGKIHVESDGDGQGSTFVFTLPHAKTEA